MYAAAAKLLKRSSQADVEATAGLLRHRRRVAQTTLGRERRKLATVSAASLVGDGWSRGVAGWGVPMTMGKKRPQVGGRKRRIECAGTLARHSRLFNCLLYTLIQRIDRRRRETYRKDLDLARIHEAIGLFAVEGLLRDPKWLKEYRSYNKSMGLDQRATNMLSVAEATGIPRETARRKIHKLGKLGYLTEIRPREYVITPGLLQTDAIRQRRENTFADVLRFINDCLELGILRWSEGRD